MVTTTLKHDPALKTEPVDAGRNQLNKFDSYHATNNKRTTRVLDKIFNTHTYRESESLVVNKSRLDDIGKELSSTNCKT